MFKIYDEDYQFKGIIFNGIKNLKYESTLSTGQRTVEFSIPLTEENLELIQEEWFLETNDYAFIIKEINIPNNNYITIFAVPDIEDWKSVIIRTLDIYNKSLVQAFNQIANEAGWDVRYNLSTAHSTTSITYQVPNITPFDAVEYLVSDGFKFKLEHWYDTKNKILYIYDQMGSVRRDIFYANDLRMKALSKSSNTYEFATALEPVDQNGNSIALINNGSRIITNYQFSDKYILKRWVDEENTDGLEGLKARAEIHLAEISQPQVSYKLALSLIDGVNLGDTIYVADKFKKLKQALRVVKILIYPLEPERSTIEISNIQPDFVNEYVKLMNSYKRKMATFQIKE